MSRGSDAIRIYSNANDLLRRAIDLINDDHDTTLSSPVFRTKLTELLTYLQEVDNQVRAEMPTYEVGDQVALALLISINSDLINELDRTLS